jgi:small-conductance mechanosensitive channel
MKRFFRNLNPTVRGFLIIAVIVLLVMVLNLYGSLLAIGMLLRIAFFLAIAFFVFLMWRERRSEIDTWSTRAKVVFYGSALIIVAALAGYFWHGLPGYDALGFIGVLACAGFAMWRIWRDEHTYR